MRLLGCAAVTASLLLLNWTTGCTRSMQAVMVCLPSMIVLLNIATGKLNIWSPFSMHCCHYCDTAFALCGAATISRFHNPAGRMHA
jgi:hypothetical protein